MSKSLRARRLTPPQLLAVVYLLGILLGTLLLHLPGVQSIEGKLSSIDLLFTATSAICITGLVVADTGEAFTRFGEIMVILLVQIGGLGILTMSTLFALLTGKRINFSNRQHLMTQLNALDVGGVLSLMRTIFMYTILSEVIGAVLLGMKFVPEFGWAEGSYQAIFHSISAYNNGGFVVLPNGLGPYAQDPLVNFTISSLVILGGLGFLVQFNVISHLLSPRAHRLLLYSKLTIWTTVILLVIGFLIILAVEWNNSNTLGALDLHGKVFAAFFQSMTPRSSGFSTVDIESLNVATIFVIIALMFIGANSGSTGGGIKTSTFAIIVGSAWNMVRGRGELVLFRRRIETENVVRAGTVVALYTLLTSAAFFLMLLTNPNIGFTHLLFETVSAAATVGLSMNTTDKINDYGLIILTVLMYLGRIGPITFAAAFSLQSVDKQGIKYPRERDIVVG